MTERTPEGWYPNPEGGRQRRYWDGSRWTDRFAYPTGAVEAGADPVRDLEQLRSSAGRAKTAVAVGVAINSVGPGVQGWQVGQTRRDLVEVREQLEFQRQAAPGFQYRPQTPSPFDATGSLLALPSLVIGILFLIWFHRAASIGTRLNRPAQRSPGWAIGGWMIPIGNFWLPYQSARDMFRQGEPGRRVVRRWWGAYIGAASASQVLALIVGLNYRIEVAVAGCALALALWMMAAVFVWEFIGDCTASLSAELTSPAPLSAVGEHLHR